MQLSNKNTAPAKETRKREDSAAGHPNIKAELDFRQQTSQSFANNQPKAPKHKREHSAKPFTG